MELPLVHVMLAAPAPLVGACSVVAAQALEAVFGFCRNISILRTGRTEKQRGSDIARARAAADQRQRAGAMRGGGGWISMVN